MSLLEELLLLFLCLLFLPFQEGTVFAGNESSAGGKSPDPAMPMAAVKNLRRQVLCNCL